MTEFKDNVVTGCEAGISATYNSKDSYSTKLRVHNAWGEDKECSSEILVDVQDMKKIILMLNKALKCMERIDD
ncbi:MAG: hypothetical protein M0R51_16855, partial [Clostridia bacterium]|nr:hypothetical protein [Clostridia bacterium]